MSKTINEREIKVYGIKWDTDTKEELDGVPTTVNFSISSEDFNDFYEDENGLEEFISDKISDISGFCHDGWKGYTTI